MGWRRNAKKEKKMAKVELIKAKGQAMIEAAKMGVTPKSGLAQVIGAVGTAAGALMGGGQSNTDPNQVDASTEAIMNINENPAYQNAVRYAMPQQIESSDPGIMGGNNKMLIYAAIGGIALIFFMKK